MMYNLAPPFRGERARPSNDFHSAFRPVAATPNSNRARPRPTNSGGWSPGSDIRARRSWCAERQRHSAGQKTNRARALPRRRRHDLVALATHTDFYVAGGLAYPHIGNPGGSHLRITSNAKKGRRQGHCGPQHNFFFQVRTEARPDCPTRTCEAGLAASTYGAHIGEQGRADERPLNAGPQRLHSRRPFKVEYDASSSYNAPKGHCGLYELNVTPGCLEADEAALGPSSAAALNKS